VINALNAAASHATGGPEGEADEFFNQLGTTTQSSGDDATLAALADDLETQRRKRG